MHAGLVFHLKVGEKCCCRLTFGPRDLAKEQRNSWQNTSTTSSGVLPPQIVFALEHLGVVVLIFLESRM